MGFLTRQSRQLCCLFFCHSQPPVGTSDCRNGRAALDTRRPCLPLRRSRSRPRIEPVAASALESPTSPQPSPPPMDHGGRRGSGGAPVFPSPPFRGRGAGLRRRRGGGG